MISHRAVVFLVVLATGCASNVYEVTLRPKDDSVERELVCWEEGGSRSKDDQRPSEDKISTMSPEELRSIASAYKAKVPKPAPVKHHFAGKFAGLLPNDIGGAGSYTRWTSPLGDLFVYVERVRGDDDPLADLDVRRTALNGLLDALAAWLEVELKGDPALPKLRAFIKGPLRRDAANVMAILWSAGPALSAAPEGEDQAGVVLVETLFRCGQYLAERRYLEPRDVPAFVRSFHDASQRNDAGPLRAMILQAVARKLGLEPGESLSGLTKLLADSERVERSLLPHVLGLPEYRRREAESKAADLPRKADIKATSVVADTLGRIYLPPHVFARDKVRVTLLAGADTIFTNGRVNREKGEITWKRTVMRSDDTNPAGDTARATPTLLYAVWARADENEQAARFGKAILSGNALAEYVVWYRGLADGERTAWDGMMANLAPGKGLPSAVSALRLPGDAETGVNDVAGIPRKLFEEGIKKEGQ